MMILIVAGAGDGDGDGDGQAISCDAVGDLQASGDDPCMFNDNQHRDGSRSALIKPDSYTGMPDARTPSPARP